MLYKIYRNNILFILLGTNLFILFTPISASLVKALFFFSFYFLLVLKTGAAKGKFGDDLELLGFSFFIYYFFSISLGFVYGYDYRYVVIGLCQILPIFIVYPIEGSGINSNKIFKLIKIFCIITAVLSILMYYFWMDIGFFRQIIEKSKLNDYEGYGMFSKFYLGNGGGRNIRATGIFQNAYNNGLFILVGILIVIEDVFQRKKNILLSIALLILFSFAIYTTRTRNIYLICFFVFITYILLSLKSKWKYSLFVFLVVCFFTTMVIGVFVGLSMQEGNSMFSRVYSWEKIFQDYLNFKVFTLSAWIGYGQFQTVSDFSPSVSYWAIDNSLLTAFLGGGIVAVFLFLRWISRIFTFLALVYRKCNSLILKSYFRINILMFVVYFLGGAMNVNIYNMVILIPALLLLKRNVFLLKKYDQSRK